jgi:hypothetical protein
MKDLSERDEKALRYARSELRRVLGELSLGDLARHVRFDLVRPTQRGPAGVLKADGYAIVPEAGEYRIASKCVRGIVHGVYGLLESLGCRWYFPGAEGEHLPARPAGPPEKAIVRNPDTLYRSVVAFWDRTGPGRSERIRENLDFAARAGYNRFYLHWPTRLQSAAKLAREQGHGLEVGIKLHTARELLPTRLFRSHPEWFRMENGKRTRKYNLCVSNAQALAEVSRNAQALAESVEIDNPELAYWQDDVPSAWCQCPKCAGLSPSEQNLRLMTAILRGVRVHNPRGSLSYLAYYATVAPPESKIPKGLFLEFAPHACCYLHDIDDPSCPKNSVLVQHLKRNLERFDLATSRVFEYWLDMALFSSYRKPVRRLPLMAERIARDVNFYRGQGLVEVETVQWMLPAEAADSPVVANPDFALLPRLLWNPQEDVAGFVRGFARDYYGSGRAADVLRLVAEADRVNPRFLCTPERGDGPAKAAKLLNQAILQCQELSRSAEGRCRERAAGLARTLRYDLERAQSGEA